MRLESIHITSFGTLRDRDVMLGEGVNLVLGRNESGKSALSMFLKFVFYGLSGRAGEDGISEKERYLSWETDEASGSVTLLASDGRRYRVERTMRASGREECRIIDAELDAPVMKGKIPGEVFLGLTESVFVSTVFVRQAAGTAVSGGDVREAIENLLLSGDETVNTKNALKKLDDERRALLHKTGRGGALYDKREEVATLEARLEASEEKGDERRSAEEELARLEAQEKDKERERASLAALVKYYPAFAAKRRLDAFRTAEQEAAAAKAALDALPGEGLDRTLEASLRQAVTTVDSLERRRDETEAELLRLDKQLSRMPGADEADTEVSAVVREGSALASKAARSAAVGAVCFVIAALTAGGAVFGYVRAGVGSLCITLAAAAALSLVLGIVFLARRGKKRRALWAFLAKWGADGLSSLEASATEIIDAACERRETDAARFDKAESLRIMEARLSEALAETGALASRAGCVGADTLARAAEAIGKVAAACETREKAAEAVRAAEMRCRILSSQLGETPEAIEAAVAAALGSEAGRAASELTEADHADAIRKIDFYDQTLTMLRQQSKSKVQRIAELDATVEQPERIRAQLAAQRAALAEMEEKYAALRLAYDTLAEAAESVRRDVVPRIMLEAGRLMSGFSHGKYAALGADEALAMTFRRGDATRSVAYLSAGTRDLGYVSLRLGLIAVLSGENRPPVVFDESFAAVDDDRLRDVSALLAASGGQVIWLSCRKAEAEAAEAAGGQIIRL